MKLQPTLLVFLLALALSACNQPTDTPQVPAYTRTPRPTSTPSLLPSPTPTTTPSPTLTKVPTSTRTPRPTNTPSPTADFAKINEFLTIYPLAADVQYTYAVTITYAISYTEQGDLIYDEWYGLMHEQVVSQYSTENGIGFDLYSPDYPRVYSFPFGGGEVSEYSQSLEFRETGVYNTYDTHDDTLFEFPLEVGKAWLAFGPDLPGYRWKVTDAGEITTPAGYFQDCYLLILHTGPDSTQKWFCNGVGVVRKYAYHHPPTWLYEMTLIEISPLPLRTATPTMTPTITRTAVPTRGQIDTATPWYTWTPTVKPTRVRTSTPTATITPEPQSTPTRLNTPAPLATPAPSTDSKTIAYLGAGLLLVVLAAAAILWRRNH